MSLWRRHALMVEDGAFSNKILEILGHLNIEGNPNCITGSKVMVILLNGGILPVGGVASGRVCAAGLFILMSVSSIGLDYIHIGQLDKPTDHLYKKI